MMQMKKCKGQQGNTLVITVMVFLAISVIASGLITVAGMEVQLAAYDLHAEQVRQTADAGVYIARDVIINYINTGRDIPEFNTIVFPNGTLAAITVKNGNIQPDGITKIITSRGMLTGNSGNLLAQKTIEAGLLINPQDNTKNGRIIYYKYID